MTRVRYHYLTGKEPKVQGKESKQAWSSKHMHDSFLGGRSRKRMTPFHVGNRKGISKLLDKDIDVTNILKRIHRVHQAEASNRYKVIISIYAMRKTQCQIVENPFPLNDE